MPRRTGIEITQLTNIGTQLAANSVIPIVNLPLDETQKANVALLGNFILSNIAPNTTSNLGPVGNVIITGGTAGQVLHTYGNGHLYWGTDDNTFPGGSNTAVQFNNNGEFGGNSNFTYDVNTNVLTITGNVAAGNLLTDNLLYANGEPWDLELPGGSNTAVQFNDDENFGGSPNFTFDKSTNTLAVTSIDVDNINIGNIEIQGVGPGTNQQVLGIVNGNTQQLGWKTIPVYYITIELRDGNTYLSSPNAVLRVYPLQQRDGSFLDLNTTQI